MRKAGHFFILFMDYISFHFEILNYSYLGYSLEKL